MKASTFIFLVGFLVTFGAVGGIETAPDATLLDSILIAIVGIGIMGCGAIMIRRAGE